MENIDCPDCKLPIDLSLILGKKRIQPNSTICHICHRPHRHPERIRMPQEINKFSERKPEITKEMIEAAKPKKEKILSGETKCCKICAQEKPVEDFYLVQVVSGRQKGQSYRIGKGPFKFIPRSSPSS